MRRSESGFTFIEVLVVMGILVTLMGMVAVLVPRAQLATRKTETAHNVRQLAALLSERSIQKGWPKLSGKAFTLSPVVLGLVEPRNPDNKRLFFAKGDVLYTPDSVTTEQYTALTLKALQAGADVRALTSFAGRRNADRDHLLTPHRERMGEPILSGDDDGPLPFPDGLVMGFPGGQAKFLTWEELGMAAPEDPDAPEPFLGDDASDERGWLKGLSSE